MNKTHVLAIASLVAIALSSSSSRAATQAKPTTTSSITIQANDIPLRDVIKLIAAQTGRDFLVESTVGSRKLTLDVMNVSLEDALDFISSRPPDFQWRRISLPSNSPLLDSADDLAKAVRQAKGTSGPSMVLIDPIKKTASVSVSESDTGPITSALKAAGWVEVYLITNDDAASSTTPKPPPPTLDDYTSKQRALTDIFLTFGPDDRRKAALFDLSLILDNDLGYGRSLLKSIAGSEEQPPASNTFALALAKYIDQLSGAQSPTNALVDAIPREMLTKVKSELVRILSAVDARIKRKTDTPSPGQ